MKYIFILFLIFMVCNVCFADTMAIQHHLSGDIITENELSSYDFSIYNNGDNFNMGYINDTGDFIVSPQFCWSRIVIISELEDIYREKWYIDEKLMGKKIYNFGLTFYYEIIYPEATSIKYNCIKGEL